MPHVREIVAIIVHILQASKFCLKNGGYGIWPRAVIFGTEVKIVAIPFRVNVHHVVKVRIFWRRLEVVRL